MPMTSYREPIRVAIFEAIRYTIEDVNSLVTIIDKNLTALEKIDKKHLEQEKLNLELTVPIKLPPGGKKGDCKAVVTLVETEFNKLGGGARIQFGEGSWLDKQQNLVSDECLIVYTAMPLANWVDCISVLKELIKEIQSKLKQQCVFLRIDNQTYGDPINLLGEVADAFPGNSEFGGIDKACITMPAEEYQERPIITVSSEVTQTAIGNNNIQISSGGASNVALGPGSITSGGDIIYNITVDHEKYEEIFAKNILLEEKLAQLKQEDDEVKQKQIAEQASTLAEQMRKEDNVEFTVERLLELGGASMTAGRLELAEGQCKQALRQSKKDDDQKSQSRCLTNLGLIAHIRSDYDEAERLYNESLAIKREIGDRRGESSCLTNLGNIADARSDYDEAERLHNESLAIDREIGDRRGEADALNNLGLIADARSDYDEAERLYNESLAIKREIGDRRGESSCLTNLGLIADARSDYDEAERLHNESLAIDREIGDRRGESRCLTNLGLIAHARSDYDEAERLFAASQAIRLELGLPIEEDNEGDND